MIESKKQALINPPITVPHEGGSSYVFKKLAQNIASYEIINMIVRQIDPLSYMNNDKFSLHAGSHYIEMQNPSRDFVREMRAYVNGFKKYVADSGVYADVYEIPKWKKESTEYGLKMWTWIKLNVNPVNEDSDFDSTAWISVEFRWGLPESCKIKYKEEIQDVQNPIIESDENGNNIIRQRVSVFDKVECSDKSFLKSNPFFLEESNID